MKKLGKDPRIADGRTLKLVKYLPSTLPISPVEVRWDKCRPADQWGDCGNSVHGCCVTATACHEVEAARACESGDLLLIPEADVIAAAEAMGGLEGMAIITRLKYWRKHGLFGTKILAFAELGYGPECIRQAVAIFGHADIGLDMPRAWERTGNHWDVSYDADGRPGSWGGHSVPIIGYDAENFYAVSWGEIVTITSAALNRYLDEAYVSILPDWYAKDQIAPSGVDVAGLMADLALVA